MRTTKLLSRYNIGTFLTIEVDLRLLLFLNIFLTLSKAYIFNRRNIIPQGMETILKGRCEKIFDIRIASTVKRPQNTKGHCIDAVLKFYEGERQTKNKKPEILYLRGKY